MAIQLLLENHLAIVTLERPEALNALSFDIMRELN
jgi:enoyl-CoA hydratase/carnithine racemase